MANKALMTFTGIGIDGSGPAYGICFGVVYDTGGVLVVNPQTDGAFYYNGSVSCTRTSTWASVKTDLEAGIKAVYGSTTTVLWLDDKGIL